MARRCVLCFGETEPAQKHGTLLAGEFSSWQARRLARCCDRDFSVSHRQFSVAARRLRSGQAGLYVLRDDPGGTLVLSAHAPRTRGNEAAPRRLDFSWRVFLNAFMGRGMAIAVTRFSHCGIDLVVSRCGFGLRIDCWPDCLQRVRIESAESTPGNTRAHRHAAGVRDFSDRLVDLAKNPRTGSVETARSTLHVCIAHGRNVDQGTGCLCVFASWRCAV